MASAERCTKNTVVVIKYQIFLCLLGRETLSIMLEEWNVALALAVTRLQVEELRVRVTLLQETDPGALTCNSSGKGS
jgi:hypothetical protein